MGLAESPEEVHTIYRNVSQKLISLSKTELVCFRRLPLYECTPKGRRVCLGEDKKQKYLGEAAAVRT